MKLDHIGIAVEDLSEASKIYTDLLGASPELEMIASEMVKVAMFATKNTRVELLEPTHDDSAIARFIDKKGQGIHHLAFEVEDLEAKLEELSSKGYRLIEGYPRRGANGKMVAFLHPKDFNGVLVELVS